MAEGDTILRAARRIDAALAGETVAVSAPNPRGRAAGIERLDGRRLDGVEAHGKNLTLRLLSSARLRRDPQLARLGPDILAPELDLAAMLHGLRADLGRSLGDALLDQALVAGIGNIFKSEACFAARIDPWRRIGDLSDDELSQVLLAAREAMQASVASGRHTFAVYRRSGQPCPVCRGPISSRGQGDANRTTYWCPRCQV
jgi:endonuclease-8